VTSTNLADLLADLAGAHPDLAAAAVPLRFRDAAGRTRFAVTTYAELDRRADAIAAGLTDMGFGPGVRTALMVPPNGDFFALAFGLLRSGAVPVLIDPGIGLGNLKTCLAEVAPTGFIGVSRAQLARQTLGWCPDARLLVTVGPPVPGGGRSLRAVERAGTALLPFSRPARPASAVAAIAFTSGSTGISKGVEYRHPHFLAQVRLLRELYGLAPGQVSVATFPPFALFGPVLGLTTVVPRMDPTRPAAVDPAEIFQAVNDFDATVLFGSPALLNRVSRGGATAGVRMPSLRRVISAGAPVSRALQRRFLDLLAPDAEIFTPYGATEALPVTSVRSAELLTMPEAGICVGRPVAGVDVAVIRITDGPLDRFSPDLCVAPGEVGEILVRGDNVTEAYAGRPAATALAKVDWDGQVAHRMGDLGYVDPAGRLWFGGRKAHRVTTRGGDLFSVPCEEVFNVHPAVARSALVGVGPPGALTPVICIELEPDRRADAALISELRAVAAGNPLTSSIHEIRYHPGFPVDIRHNAKINREVLAAWVSAGSP
jgi:acyl-CoA synthetase (AMP-forming)/AMP-acid ligase II